VTDNNPVNADLQSRILDAEYRVNINALRPCRQSTKYVVMHRIGVGRCALDVEEFFTKNAEGVATVTVRPAKLAETIKKWKLYGVPERYKARAFVPYHFVIDLNGGITQFLDYDARGAHCYGYNSHSIGVACIGDFRIEKTTDAQMYASQVLCRDLLFKYGETVRIKRHDDLRRANNQRIKGCPGRNYPFERVKKWAEIALKNKIEVDGTRPTE
jgi:hypothetical protein